LEEIKMGLVVMKFGGTSVRDAERLNNVAKRVIAKANEGNQIVVVVSAQGDTTDILVEKAAEISDSPSKREMDVLLSAGEQMSMSLLAMTINKNGSSAISLTGRQAGVHTSSNYSSARILRINCERIRYELERKNIVIVAGFQGINKYDDITTLGRGGSDTSAVALAAALDADLCEIYTDVDGVYTADPRIVPNAKKLSTISYDEMLELASLGANVLHNRSVEIALKYSIPLCVRSSLTNEEGTYVREGSKVEKMLVRGVTRDNKVARVTVVNVEDKPGRAFKIFAALAKRNIEVDVILQSLGRNETKDVSFTVASHHLNETLEILNELIPSLSAESIEYAEDISKVSIVGAGMASNPGVAATMFEALYEAGINIQMISTSEIKVSVLIDEKDAEKAVAAIHSKFEPEM
jgi:aspartate kinase